MMQSRISQGMQPSQTGKAQPHLQAGSPAVEGGGVGVAPAVEGGGVGVALAVEGGGVGVAPAVEGGGVGVAPEAGPCRACRLEHLNGMVFHPGIRLYFAKALLLMR